MQPIYDSHPDMAQLQYADFLQLLNNLRSAIGEEAYAWFLRMKNEGLSGPVLLATLRAAQDKERYTMSYMIGCLRNILARCEQDSMAFTRLADSDGLW